MKKNKAKKIQNNMDFKSMEDRNYLSFVSKKKKKQKYMDDIHKLKNDTFKKPNDNIVNTHHLDSIKHEEK